MEQVWNTDEVAKHLKRTPGAVRNLVLRRAIPYRKAGGRLVFFPAEIQRWLEDSPGVRPEDITSAAD